MTIAEDVREGNINWLSGGRVHNWKNHVGKRVQRIWPTLTPEQREAVALDADEEAMREEWE